MFSHIKELFTRPSGYTIAKSVRLRSSASAYLNRTFGTPTLSTKWTWSGWLKFGYGSSYYTIFDGGSPDTRFGRDPSTNQLYVNNDTTNYIITTPVYRDYSAWYHAVLAFDSSQGTASNRLRLYINGSEVTAFATDNRSSISGAIGINTATAHGIGRQPSGGSAYFDGYLTEINFIDGQALTPSSFGETDSITGVWKAKKYGGTYGTNGFYLNFSDNSSNTATTIGKDYSGNGNNWTPNNISVTAGVTYDSMVDSPTVSAVSSNYAVLNPLNKAYSTYTLSDGNLNWTSSTINMGSHGTFQLPTSGKYYWEIVMTANAGGSPAIGIADGLDSLGSKGIEYRTSGNKEQNGGVSGNGSGAYGATWTTNDVIGVAYDADTSSGQITFYKNNSSQGVAYSSIQTNFPNGLFPSFQNNAAGTTTFQANFGQRPFTYTPPTGYVALNTNNLPVPTIKNGAAYMAATLYTGNGSTQSISNAVNGTSFQPDLVWVKGRSVAYSHGLYDSVRGVNKRLISNLTNAEDTLSGVSAFSSGGFSLGSDINFNQGSATYVGWQWKANGSAVTNTAGSITSTVSAGATQGFSVVTFTAPASGNFSAGHGLGVTPGMVITKVRGRATSWITWHNRLNSGSPGTTYYVELNTTGGQSTFASVWGSTGVTSSVIGMGIGASCAASDTIVAYCFAAVAGYSAFGSYTGNGSADGPFVFTNFRPRWILLKRTDSAADWFIGDTSRNTANSVNNLLQPSSANAESTYGAGAGEWYDLLSNGFKIRSTITSFNASGGTYIYACFAENPLKYALAR